MKSFILTLALSTLASCATTSEKKFCKNFEESSKAGNSQNMIKAMDEYLSEANLTSSTIKEREDKLISALRSCGYDIQDRTLVKK